MTNEAFTCPLHECISFDWYHLAEDHRSPHDAWVECITISEPSSGDRHQNRGLEIHVQLIGAYHDGTIEFTYKRVHHYSIQAMRDTAGHGDWLEDGVDVRRHDTLLHRVTLTNGGFEIEAEGIEYMWTPLPSVSKQRFLSVIARFTPSAASARRVRREFCARPE